MIEAKKETFCINQIIGQKTEMIMVEGDCIVPDIKPDILKSIQTNGNVFISKKEVLDGKVRLEGNLEIYIVYLADDEKNTIRILTTSIGFSETIEWDSCKAQMKLNEEVRVKNIDCRVLNGRKISVSTTLEVELAMHSNDNIEIIEDISNMDDVQFLRDNLDINSYIGEGFNKIYAKDTLKIDNIDMLAEILKVDITIINKDIKVSYNKILTKADAEVNIMYLTEDNRIGALKGLIPVMGFVDIPSISENNIIDLKHKIRNIAVRPNSTEEQSIYVEIEIDLNAMAYENKKINMIQDLYSPSKNLKCKQRKISACTGRSFVRDTCSVKERIETPELSGCNIHDVKVIPSIINKTILNDKILVEGDVNVNIMFSREETGGLDTQAVTLPYTYEAGVPGINSNSNVQIELNVENKDLVILPEGNSDIRIDMSVELDVSRNAGINIIDEIEDEEKDSSTPYNMTIYFVKRADSLWSIAKRFGSTMEDIMEVNELENEGAITEGQQLFIPKFQRKNRIIVA